MGFFKSVGKALGGAAAVINPVAAIGTIGGALGIGSAGAIPAITGKAIADNIGSMGQYLPIAAGAGLGALAGNPMAGAQIGAGIYSGQMAAQSQENANAMNIALAQQQMMFSAQQAQAQMAFQERMSSTSIQRAQRDMLAAGINPMLAPTAQESSPTGAMGSYTAAHVDPVPSVAMSALSNAKDTLKMFQDIAESKSKIVKNIKDADVSVQTAKEKSSVATISKTVDNIVKKAVNSAKSFNFSNFKSWASSTPPSDNLGWRTKQALGQ